MVKVPPFLMALDFHRLLLIKVCKGILLLICGCGAGLTVDLTVILNLPVGTGTGNPVPLYYICASHVDFLILKRFMRWAAKAVR